MNKTTYVLGNLCKNAMPGKKIIQKLVYLIERKGLDLGMDYSMHFYGPYSADLDQFLHELEANNTLEIDTSGTTHKIRFHDNLDDNPLTPEEYGILDEAIITFSNKSALDLEVLTTTDYVANTILKAPVSNDKIIETVIQIKCSKFQKNQIANCIRELTENKLLTSDAI